ncbi:MAG: PRD domain-containing protein [Gordonia sp. (in: high G+C Gram-positive bacteria)]
MTSREALTPRHDGDGGVGVGTLIRVLNNNAVLIDVGGRRLILLGRGVGFRGRLGDRIELDVADEIFSPSTPAELRQLAEFAREIPIDVFDVARAAVAHAAGTAAIPSSQALLISIADHLNYAVIRVEQGVDLDFPLKWEIGELYPREMALGRATVGLARDKLGVAIPDDEAVALAMHFVNAQFARADVSETVAMTRMLSQIVDVVSAGFGGDGLAADSVSVARFVTHLRYLCARIGTASQIVDAPPLRRADMHQTIPALAGVAAKVRLLIERDRGALTDAEMMYLELHLARLARLAPIQ